jgi:hypothetical protein
MEPASSWIPPIGRAQRRGSSVRRSMGDRRPCDRRSRRRESHRASQAPAPLAWSGCQPLGLGPKSSQAQRTAGAATGNGGPSATIAPIPTYLQFRGALGAARRDLARLQASGWDVTIADLHDAIQAACGGEDSHVYCFHANALDPTRSPTRPTRTSQHARLRSRERCGRGAFRQRLPRKLSLAWRPQFRGRLADGAPVLRSER